MHGRMGVQGQRAVPVARHNMPSRTKGGPSNAHLALLVQPALLQHALRRPRDALAAHMQVEAGTGQDQAHEMAGNLGGVTPILLNVTPSNHLSPHAAEHLVRALRRHCTHRVGGGCRLIKQPAWIKLVLTPLICRSTMPLVLCHGRPAGCLLMITAAGPCMPMPPGLHAAMPAGAHLPPPGPAGRAARPG